MADIAISITDAQFRVLRALDPAQSVKKVLQTHVDTWLAPMVAEMDVSDRKEVMAAYLAASPSIQTTVKGLLGLG